MLAHSTHTIESILSNPQVGILRELCEKDLVRVYRSTKSGKIKNKIFRIILFERGCGGATWHQIIHNFIQQNRSRLDRYNMLSESDLYQEACTHLHIELEKWFDPDVRWEFSTYTWDTIKTSMNILFKRYAKIKRKTSSNIYNLEINNLYGEHMKYEEVISSESVGKLQTANKEDGKETKYFQRVVVDCINKKLATRDVEIPKELADDLLKIIKMKANTKEVLAHVSKKHNITKERLVELKKIYTEEFEKMMFKDIIRYSFWGIKDDGLLSKKFNRSRGQITKVKYKLYDFAKKELKKEFDLTVDEIFFK